MNPLIIAYYDGDPEVRVLSNFAKTPFVLDDIHYQTAEGFWQCLKTEDPITRMKIAFCIDGLDARQLGRKVASGKTLFTYSNNLYVVGSWEHHFLLERAIRAKVEQNEDVEKCLWDTKDRPLKHMLKNKYGTWKPGDSAALPAFVFEDILTRIRTELRNGTFEPQKPIPGSFLGEPGDSYA